MAVQDTVWDDAVLFYAEGFNRFQKIGQCSLGSSWIIDVLWRSSRSRRCSLLNILESTQSKIIHSCRWKQHILQMYTMTTCIRLANIELSPGVLTTAASEDLLRPWKMPYVTLAWSWKVFAFWTNSLKRGLANSTTLSTFSSCFSTLFPC